MAKNGPWTFNVSICANTDEEIIYKNMPSSDSFLFNSTRHITLVDLSGMNVVRLVVNKQSIAGNTNSKLTLKWSETFSSDVNDYNHIGEFPVEINIDTENQFLVSDWIYINSDVPKKDVYIALIGSGGDDQISPHFGHISLNFA